MSTRCLSGQIMRSGYTYKKKSSKKTIKVKSSCIKDQGKPGKGPKLITMPKYDVGLLSDYGYSLSKPYEERIKAIKKSLKKNPKLKILQHINALRTLFKSNEKYYNKLNKDLKWLQSIYDKL
jgi:hypothetical protein